MNLTFKQLNKQNTKRCIKYFHPIKQWSETDWGCALAGEVGELCNILKKRKRYLTSVSYKNHPKKNEILKQLRNEAKHEIGDIMAYLDLLATALDTNVESCTRNKFNQVSDKYGSKIKL